MSRTVGRALVLLLILGVGVSLPASLVGLPQATAAVASRPGSPSDHTWLFGNGPLQWQSCRPLTYRVNTLKAPRGWKQTIRTSLRKATQASGLRFRSVGHSDQVVTSDSTNPAGTDIMIAFLAPKQTDMLPAAYVAGQGGAATDGQQLFNGRLVLNGPQLAKMAEGFGTGPRTGIQGTQGEIVMHELGHVLGLGHAHETSQIMYPAATRKVAEWGAGDYAGLRILGRGGCSPRQSPVARQLVNAAMR